jgi:hypothetical protein
MNKMLLAMAGAFALPCTAHSAVLTYDISAAFEGGFNVSGTFQLDNLGPASSQFSNIDLLVNGTEQLNTLAQVVTSAPGNHTGLVLPGFSNADQSLEILPAFVATYVNNFEVRDIETQDLIQADTSFVTFDGTTFNFYALLSGTITKETSPIPEPASWALMIGGFAVVGGAMRGRSTITSSLA